MITGERVVGADVGALTRVAGGGWGGSIVLVEYVLQGRLPCVVWHRWDPPVSVVVREVAPVSATGTVEGPLYTAASFTIAWRVENELSPDLLPPVSRLWISQNENSIEGAGNTTPTCSHEPVR